MDCTRVLPTFGSHPQPTEMQVDLAMCLSLSQRRRLYQLLSMKPALHRYPPTGSPRRTSSHSFHQPTASQSSASSLSSPPTSSQLQSCFLKKAGGLCKKRVVFADAKGLALTAVHLFMPDTSSFAEPQLIDSCPNIAPNLKKTQKQKYRLGFPQPALDSKVFLARLRETNVQLESCSVSECSLRGKVHVCHGSTDKAVHLRLTFDSWQHHVDIPCMFLQQQRCGAFDVDVFTFDLRLPQTINPTERVQFCVAFRPGCGTSMHWDNNRGKNYKVCMEKDTGQNYPSLPKHRPPSCPSYVCPSISMQNHADLSFFQGGSHVQSEWNGDPFVQINRADDSIPVKRATRTYK
ncbi:protein phosphatase 1 regulatory subunit 3C-B [Hippocampus comes]|uniref:Protein phosphatase 1 regulatory subunit 3C-B-like n=1 Tax=Hippocampus comes TaxID=109280 RepID=A0A3Q2YYB9_HIPCM|nr:PREDICTED: protein phosphatase 1 regulatory subunit 3C-B-like [Hippocampus comes]XP_019749505.1 PREDICTED: protein phosphatase 1 regulatory subunit 3C-B-like [Hippocampus comes]XP_019749514.1 PREDICTED: protein phosphatase 1 regulatory subunit 3C-B-like [Hippocampus comes]